MPKLFIYEQTSGSTWFINEEYTHDLDMYKDVERWVSIDFEGKELRDMRDLSFEQLEVRIKELLDQNCCIGKIREVFD